MIAEQEDDDSVLQKMQDATGGHGDVAERETDRGGLAVVQSAQAEERG